MFRAVYKLNLEGYEHGRMRTTSKEYQQKR